MAFTAALKNTSDDSGPFHWGTKRVFFVRLTSGGDYATGGVAISNAEALLGMQWIDAVLPLNVVSDANETMLGQATWDTANQKLKVYQAVGAANTFATEWSNAAGDGNGLALDAIIIGS